MADEKVEVRDFEGLIKDLTQLVERLERGNMPLEEAIAQYAKGVELLKEGQGVLDSAQARLDVLTKAANGTLKIETIEAGKLMGDL